MSPLGNSRSVGGSEGLGATPVADESSVTPPTAGDEDEDDGDDEGSDPSEVVVSPQNSPNVSPAKGGRREVFHDDNESGMAVSPSFIHLGLKAKATPFALKSWNSLALTLDGRDKITKLFQYLCRLLSWWYAGRGSEQLALRFSSLYTSLANSRKAFRLGRSLIEIEKLRNVGLGQLLMWHLRNSLGLIVETDVEGETSPRMTPTEKIPREVSSNIGVGSSSVDDAEVDTAPKREPQTSFVRSFSLSAYRAITLPFRVTVSSLFGSRSVRRTCKAAELWVTIGSAFKIIGLLGFWTADNINYVCSTGFLDDHSLPASERLAKRTRLQTLSSVRANQAYFGGAIAGLLVNTYAYNSHRRDKLAAAERKLKEVCENKGDDQIEEAQKHLTAIKKEQFSLFLALLKSCCDVIVFSNNPGIDLHQKYRGKKNHEGIHCVCGLVSAGTVLFSNFPDKY